MNGANTPRWRLVPTRREQAKWDRAAKAATGGTVSNYSPLTDLLVALTLPDVAILQLMFTMKYSYI